MRENANTDWHPETIKSGRYGDWLENNIDWALSRNRYWGTPLPIWRCEEGHIECMGSRKELSARTGNDLDALDPHRPFVDDIYFDCPQCGGQMKRVPEVIDCWYDSGAMPFAQLGYPHKPGSVEAFEKTWSSLQTSSISALLSTLLALPHSIDVLRTTILVHQDYCNQGSVDA